jgi:hypothetical protein
MCSPGWRSRPPAQARRQLSTHEPIVANPPSSTNSLWEHLMSNSPQLANRTAIRDNGQGRELRLQAHEKTGAARQNRAQASRLDPREMSSGPSIMPAATTPADHENAWRFILQFAACDRDISRRVLLDRNRGGKACRARAARIAGCHFFLRKSQVDGIRA